MDVLTEPIRERVVTFGENGGLTGILTLPVGGPGPGVPFVVLLNSGLIHRVGPNRLHVELARALVMSGIPTLRFDLAGIGDSERETDAISLLDSVDRDITAALTMLADEYGAEQFALIGLCSGAVDAFRTALRDERVTAAVMLDMPGPFHHWSQIAHHLTRRALRLRSWRNPFKKFALYSKAFVDVNLPEEPARAAMAAPGIRTRATRPQLRTQLDYLLARHVKLYFIFTSGVEQNYNHRAQFRRCFPRAAANPGLSLDFVRESDHLFSSRRTRNDTTDRIHAWMLRNIVTMGLLLMTAATSAAFFS